MTNASSRQVVSEVEVCTSTTAGFPLPGRGCLCRPPEGGPWSRTTANKKGVWTRNDSLVEATEIESTLEKDDTSLF